MSERLTRDIKRDIEARIGEQPVTPYKKRIFELIEPWEYKSAEEFEKATVAKAIEKLKLFCKGYGVFMVETLPRRMVDSVKLHYGGEHGYFLPYLGNISIVNPYLRKEEILTSVEKQFPYLRFRPDFFADKREIEIYVPDLKPLWGEATL